MGSTRPGGAEEVSEPRPASAPDRRGYGRAGREGAGQSLRRPCRGEKRIRDIHVPRVPLRSTRGYTPPPLRGD